MHYCFQMRAFASDCNHKVKYPKRKLSTSLDFKNFCDKLVQMRNVMKSCFCVHFWTFLDAFEIFWYMFFTFLNHFGDILDHFRLSPLSWFKSCLVKVWNKQIYLTLWNKWSHFFTFLLKKIKVSKYNAWKI